MTSERTLQLTRARASEVLHALERFGVTPTPENYRVWYVHLSGELPALSARLRQIVEAGETLGETHFAELHERFFLRAAEERSLLRAGQRLNDLAGDQKERCPTGFGLARRTADRLLQVSRIDPAGNPAEKAQLPARADQTRFLGEPDVQLTACQRQRYVTWFHLSPNSTLLIFFYRDCPTMSRRGLVAFVRIRRLWVDPVPICRVLRFTAQCRCTERVRASTTTLGKAESSRDPSNSDCCKLGAHLSQPAGSPARTSVHCAACRLFEYEIAG